MFSDESLFCGEKLNQLKKYFFLLIGIEKKANGRFTTVSIKALYELYINGF